MPSIPETHTPKQMVRILDNVNTIARVGAGADINLNEVIHTDLVYNAMLNATKTMEERLSRRTSSSCSTTCSSGTSP